MIQTPVKVQAIRYSVTAMPDDGPPDSYAWMIHVERREADSWAIRHVSRCLNSLGVWEVEPPSDERTSRWLSTHRFSKAKALEIAEKMAPYVRVNRLTAQEAYELFKKRIQEPVDV